MTKYTFRICSYIQETALDQKKQQQFGTWHGHAFVDPGAQSGGEWAKSDQNKDMDLKTDRESIETDQQSTEKNQQSVEKDDQNTKMDQHSTNTLKQDTKMGLHSTETDQQSTAKGEHSTLKEVTDERRDRQGVKKGFNLEAFIEKHTGRAVARVHESMEKLLSEYKKDKHIFIYIHIF